MIIAELFKRQRSTPSPTPSRGTRSGPLDTETSANIPFPSLPPPPCWPFSQVAGVLVRGELNMLSLAPVWGCGVGGEGMFLPPPPPCWAERERVRVRVRRKAIG